MLVQSQDSNSRIGSASFPNLVRKGLAKETSTLADTFVQTLHLVSMLSVPFDVITLCFTLFKTYTLFPKVNFGCGIASISGPMFSRKCHAVVQAISVANYQSYFRIVQVFFSGKQQGAIRIDQKVYSRFFYHRSMVVIILKVAASLSIFSAIRPFFSTVKEINEK